MTQPIENEVRIRGTVREVRPGPAEDWVELVVDVEAVEDVAGWPNLLRDRAGQQLTITTGADEVSQLGLTAGHRVEIGAELRGPGAVWSRPGALKRA